MSQALYQRLAQSLGMLLLVLGLSACGTSSQSTRGAQYPEMYSARPTSILVMPPINETNHVEASEYLYSSITMPLAERGYYVFSPYLAIELLRSESAGDAEPFLEASLRPFRSVFNADAVLFTRIKRWEKNVVGGYIRVAVDYILRSAITDETLFARSADISVDTRASIGNGLLVDLIANAISTAATSKIVGARKTNLFMFGDIPDGKYAPLHGADQQVGVASANISGAKVR